VLFCGENMTRNAEYYGKYCKQFIEICRIENNVVSSKRFVDYGLPSADWFVRHCPDDTVNKYSDFVLHLGLKPNKRITKEHASKLIIDKYNRLERSLKYDDFRNPNGYDEIGISIVNYHWGTFNKMLTDLGMAITRESMFNKHKTIDELESDIWHLCDNIYKIENRLNISYDDIRNCGRCSSPSTYNTYFNKKLNISISDYIKSIGFIPNKEGMGMVFNFDNGEITTSKFEYQVSKYLRDKVVSYSRNVMYSEFISDYNGTKDCDYVIQQNGIWFIEVAGMLDYTKVKKNKDDKIRTRYKLGIEEKEKMLSKSNLQYKIIYPTELYQKSLDEVFYFLYK